MVTKKMINLQTTAILMRAVCFFVQSAFFFQQHSHHSLPLFISLCLLFHFRSLLKLFLVMSDILAYIHPANIPHIAHYCHSTLFTTVKKVIFKAGEINIQGYHMCEGERRMNNWCQSHHETIFHFICFEPMMMMSGR